MIVIIAPYSPIGESSQPHLGAARKLETVIGLLYRIDPSVVLVNTAHNKEIDFDMQIRLNVINGITIQEIIPECFQNRKIGKFRNLLQVKQILNVVLNIGKPRLVWLYDGYAFESLFALAIRKQVHCPIVLEFEDWHFSRWRGLINLKPLIDYVVWRKSMSIVSHVYAVNTVLAEKVAPYSVRTELLPGVVPSPLADIVRNYPPFRRNESVINIGYFGGLSAEKGVDTLLDLVERLPAGYRLVISGTGPLDDALKDRAKCFPDKAVFHGMVTDTRLYELITQCDVILNPHRPINEMGNGVFPFKVIEAVASGRMLISTAVPKAGLEELLSGVCFYDGSIDALIEAIISAAAYYEQHALTIRSCAILANDRFGESALLASIQRILN